MKLQPGDEPQATERLDADLLAAMAMADRREVRAPGRQAVACNKSTALTVAAAAREAWGEFYARHVEYLYRVCLRSYGPLLGGEPGAADLVADVFRLAFERADRFRPDGAVDPQRQRLRVRAWLGWLARRRAQDILRGRMRLAETGGDVEYLPQPERPEGPGGESAAATAMREALESLTEREQLVLRTTMQWYRPEKTHQRLPDEVAAELAATLKTTPENLRQIRRRAMKKLSVDPRLPREFVSELARASTGEPARQSTRELTRKSTRAADCR